MTVATEVAVRPYELFPAQARSVRRISPHLVRITFSDEALRDFADNGYDQRLKLILPGPEGTLDDMPRGEDWFHEWRVMDTARRPIIRTYTVRAVRAEVGEMDIDLVDHGDLGPASAFAGSAQGGEQVLLYGPSASYDGVHGGLEFRTDLEGVADQLLVGDESAVPAVAAILERLPASARGLVCLEVGSSEDVLDLVAPQDVQIIWCVRGEQRGERQLDAVRRWLTDHPQIGGGGDGATTVLGDGEDAAYWEVTTERGEDVPPLSAWIAGESSVVRAMRRVLVREFDIPKSAVAFMGYWREGHQEC